MSRSGIIITLRCMDCGKACLPSEVVRIGESAIQCWDCYDKTRQVFESWADPPKECALCHVTFSELISKVPGQAVSMFPHWIDGTLGLLCSNCDRAYVQKRADQFRGTRFGQELKL